MIENAVLISRCAQYVKAYKKTCLPGLQAVDVIPGLPSPQLPQLPVGFPQADVPLSTETGAGAGSPHELSDFVWELGISPQP